MFSWLLWLKFECLLLFFPFLLHFSTTKITNSYNWIPSWHGSHFLHCFIYLLRWKAFPLSFPLRVLGLWGCSVWVFWSVILFKICYIPVIRCCWLVCQNDDLDGSPASFFFFKNNLQLMLEIHISLSIFCLGRLFRGIR